MKLAYYVKNFWNYLLPNYKLPEMETVAHEFRDPLRSFTHDTKRECFGKGGKVRGRSAERWRYDASG